MLDVVACAVLALIPVSAQQSELPPDIQAALDLWRTDYGATWQVFLDEDTLMGRMLFNGNADYPPLDPSSDEERRALARALVGKAYGIFGLDDSTLIDDRVKFLPLGMIGTTDKRTIRFRQKVSGVPVIGATVNVLLSDADLLLAIDSQALPYMDGFDVAPNVDPAAAAAEAASAFYLDTGIAAEQVGTPELRILPHYANELRTGFLIWDVEVAAEDESGLSLAYLYRVTAKLPATVLDREDLVLNAFPASQQQQGGIYASVKANVTRGDDGDGLDELSEDWLPDNGTNFEARPMPYLTVWRVLPTGKKAFLTTTNSNGEFFLPGNLNGIEVEVDFKGTYVDVCNMANAERSFCTSCQNGPIQKVLGLGTNTLFMNPGYDEGRVAQANVYYYMNFMRDWIRAVDPTDSTFDDGPAPEDVNQLPGEEQVASYKVRPNYDGGPNVTVCQLAQFSSPCVPGPMGSPLERFDFLWFSKSIPGDDCKNTAFATIIFHEMGHWLNVLYGNGNRKAFGEGCADVWALYVADFAQMGTFVNSRNGDNVRAFCGDCPRGPEPCSDCQECHGKAHKDGEVLMGALWKVRKRLKEFQGDDLGAAIANSLFLSWMQAFDTDRVLSVIEYQWLVLDAGADGILVNAPHKSEIDWGFLQQGFPGFQIPPFRYSCR